MLPQIIDSSHKTILFYGVFYSDLITFMTIVKKTKDLNHPDVFGKRAIDYAIENELFLKCEILIQNGASIFSNSIRRMAECESLQSERRKYIGQVLIAFFKGKNETEKPKLNNWRSLYLIKLSNVFFHFSKGVEHAPV